MTEVSNPYVVKTPSDDDWIDLHLQGTRSSAQVFAERCSCPIGIRQMPFRDRDLYTFFARRRDFKIVVTLLICSWPGKRDPRPTLAWPADHAEELLP